MGRTKDSRRENFDVTPKQQADIEALQNLLDAPSKKDAVLYAVQVALHLASETRQGNQIFIRDQETHDMKRFVLLGLEKPRSNKWMYLCEHAHPWKRELYVKGRKLPASAVWTTSIANNMTVQETAVDWELPVKAVEEIYEYCESHKVLLEMEAAEDMRLLKERGIKVDPEASS